MSDDKEKSSAGILKKIINNIRQESRTLAEAVMDSTGDRIFEHQIADARANVAKAKAGLTDELTKALQHSRKVKILNDRINQQELLIVDAMGEGDETLAFELATVMVELESDRDAQQAICQSHDLHLAHLKRQMEQAERSLKDLERQLEMVNTTQQIQQATELISKNFVAADKKMLSAKKTLDRIKAQQQITDKQYSVADDYYENNIKQTLPKNTMGSLSEQDIGDEKNTKSNEATDGAAGVLKRIFDKE